MLGAIFLATLHMALTFISCLNNRITFTLAVNIKPTKIQLYLIPTWTRQKQRRRKQKKFSLTTCYWKYFRERSKKHIKNCRGVFSWKTTSPKGQIEVYFQVDRLLNGVYWVWSCKSSIQCSLCSIFMVKSQVYFWVRFFGTPYKKF